MYVKGYNIEIDIPSTMVRREASSEGFDVYMPVIYNDPNVLDKPNN
jgi:hypothetical protein